jgi:hypothetical protein
MVPDMLLLRTDEVARNGAFGKILRPEVFPDAPLQLRLSPKYTPFGSPPSPRKSSQMRISRETGGVLFYSLFSKIPIHESQATTS